MKNIETVKDRLLNISLYESIIESIKSLISQQIFLDLKGSDKRDLLCGALLYEDEIDDVNIAFPAKVPQQGQFCRCVSKVAYLSPEFIKADIRNYEGRFYYFILSFVKDTVTYTETVESSNIFFKFIGFNIDLTKKNVLLQNLQKR